MIGQPYTEEEVREIITTKEIKQTSIKLGRTYASVAGIRSNYKMFIVIGKNPGGRLWREIFTKLKEEGVAPSVPYYNKGLRNRQTPVVTISTDVAQEIPEKSIRDPFTEFDILCTNFNKRAREIVYMMVEDVYMDHIKKEYDRLERRALDVKNISSIQKRILKGGSI